MAGSLQIGDLIANVSAQAGIAQEQARSAVGTILSMLVHEAEGSHITDLLAKIPGAGDLVQQYDVMAAQPAAAPARGLMGMVAGALGSVLGARAQPVIIGVERLTASGLGLGEIERVGAALMTEARSFAGPDLIGKVMASAPSLSRYLGPAPAAAQTTG
jgi:hypothetical protein